MTFVETILLLGALLPLPTSAAEPLERLRVAGAPATAAIVTQAQWVNDSTRFVIAPKDPSVVPKTTPRESTPAASEWILIIERAASLDDILRPHGVDEPTYRVVAGLLSNTLTSLEMPKGAVVRLLMGPDRRSRKQIPYRLSVYLPDPRSGELIHAVTVALTDRGDYVLGVSPPALADLPGAATGEVPRVGDSAYQLKVDRYRPGP